MGMRCIILVVLFFQCGIICVSYGEVTEWDVIDECHEECVSNLVVQNNNDLNIRCNDSCKVDKCINGCDMWQDALESNCQELCNGTAEQLPIKALYCMMGCHFALNVYVKKVKDDIGTPPAPVLVAGSQTNDSVSIWWNGASNPNITYLVQLKYDTIPGEWEYYMPSKPLQQPACKVTNLHPYTKYKFRIAWLILPQYGPLISNESVVISTLAYGMPNSAPSVSLSVIDPTRILVSWDPPFFSNGPILSYAVSLKDPAIGHVLVKDVPTQNAERFFLFNNLRPATTYSVSVLARNSMGEGPSRSANTTTPSKGQIQTTDDLPYLVFGARQQVIKQGIDLFDETVVLYQPTNKSVVTRGVALHIVNQDLFVSDSSGFVYRVSLAKSQQSTVILRPSSKSNKPGILSVDWLNNKLYIVDENKISRCDLDGKNYQVVIKGLHDTPSDMKVDPYNGYLYWILRLPVRVGLYKIDLADLSSSPLTLTDAKLIFSEEKLMAFAADYSSLQLLLPLETKNTVYAISLDGHEFTDVRQNTQKPQFRGVRSFVVNHGLFIWTTGDDVMGEEYQLTENKYYHNVYPVMRANKPFVGLNLLHPDAQPCPVPLNPVRQVEAVFDQEMARVSWTTPRLLRGIGRGAWQKWLYELRVSDQANNIVVHAVNVTATSYTVHNLHANETYYIKVRAFSRGGKGPWSEEFRGRTLRKNVDKGFPFMLWSSKEDILKSNMIATAVQPFIHCTAFHRSHVIDMSWYEDLLFLNTNSTQIYVFNTTSQQPPVRLESISSAHSLAVDWFGKKLYWSNPYQQVISRANFDGSQQEPLPIPTVARELNVDSPGAYLYWTTMYSVECARLHGIDRQVYFQAGFFAGKQVLGLTVDRDYKKVYWMVRSQEGGHLYRATMAGHTPNSIKATVQEVAILQEDIIRGPIRYHSDRLFWLHNQREALITDMSGRNVANLHGPGLSNLKTLTIVDPLQQPYPDGFTRDTLNVCPHQLVKSSIKVHGTWRNFSLSWQPVSNVNYGRVYYEIKMDSDYDRNTVITQDNEFIYRRANLLPPYVNITIAIRAFTYWSSSRRVIKIVRSPMAAPSEPLHPRVFISHEKSMFNLETTVISAELRWSSPEKPNGIILGYKVQCWKLKRTIRLQTCNETLHPKKLVYIINGLEANSTYYFQIMAFTEAGFGSGSQTVEAKSSEETPIPRILLTTSGAVEIADMDAHEEQFVAMDTAEPVDVTYLSEDGIVFWIDRKGGLMRSLTNGSDRTQLYSLTHTGSSIAVDWVGRYLYWSEIDQSTQSSSVWKLDLNYDTEPKQIIENPGAIRTLRTNPFSDTLLWTLENDDNPGILMTSKSDGRDVKVLFENHDEIQRGKRDAFCSCSDQVDVGQALSVDIATPKEQEILWVDKLSGHIWAADINGCRCRVVVNSSLVTNNVGLPPTSITVDKTHIYWSNATLNSIFSLEKDDGRNESPTIERPSSVKSEMVNDVHVITAMGSGLQPLPELRCLVPSEYQSPPIFEGRTATSLTFKMEEVKFPPDCQEYSRPSPYYIVYYRLARENDTDNCSSAINSCSTLKSYDSTATISNLLPFRDYAVQVVAGNHYNNKHSSLTPERFYMTGEGAPSKPQEVTAEVINPEKVLIRWLPPEYLNGPLIHYYLHWESVQVAGGFQKQGKQMVNPDIQRDNGKLQAILTSLDPGQTYYVAVRTYSARMDAFNESEKIAVTTFPRPGNITEEEVSSGHLLLQWRRPNAVDILDHALSCKKVYSGELITPLQIHKFNATTDLYLFNPLSPKTKFSCQMQVNYCSISEFCNYTWPKDDRISFETLGDKPGDPGVPFVTYLRKESYQVAWSPASDNGGRVLYYTLEAKVVDKDDKGASSWHKVYNGSQWKWLITGLNLDQEYVFRVVALSEYGYGNYSQVSLPFNFSDAVSTDEEAHVILAVSVSAIAVLILITLCILYKVCRARNKSKLQEAAYNVNGSLNLELATLQDLPNNGNFIHQTNILYSVGNHLIDEELAALPHIGRDQIVLTKFLGSGAFGEVFEGFARDLNNGADENRRVAIKTLRKGATDQEKTEFLKEAQLMSNFKHEHILRLLGICLDNDPNFIILELMEGGDLLSYLRSNRPTTFETSSLTVQDLISICVDVAKGCKYLEEMHFVHRDLAARNCLVSSRNPTTRVVKIGDFGLARDIYKNDYYRKEGEGLLPVRWMSPESLMDGVFTTQSDVWAFGVLLWEVMTLGQQPYPARTNLEVLHYVRAGGRLDKPDNCPDDLHQLMLLCWNYNPDDRPTFMYCQDQLQELKRKSAELPNCVHNNNYVARNPNSVLNDGIYNPGYSEETCQLTSGFDILNARSEVGDRRSLNLSQDNGRGEPTVKRAVSWDARHPRPQVDIPKYLQLVGEEVNPGLVNNDGYEIPIKKGNELSTNKSQCLNKDNPKYSNMRHCTEGIAVPSTSDTRTLTTLKKASWC